MDAKNCPAGRARLLRMGVGVRTCRALHTYPCSAGWLMIAPFRCLPIHLIKGHVSYIHTYILMCIRMCVPLYISWHSARATSEFHACMFYLIRYSILHTHVAKIRPNLCYAIPTSRTGDGKIRASVSIELIGGSGGMSCHWHGIEYRHMHMSSNVCRQNVHVYLSMQ